MLFPAYFPCKSSIASIGGNNIVLSKHKCLMLENANTSIFTPAYGYVLFS